MKGKSNYERVILILAALAAILGSGWLIYSSMGFSETLATEPATEKKDFGVVPIDKVNESIKRIAEPSKPWTAPQRNNKTVPLNKSVLLVLKDDVPYDLYEENPQLRPPMSNEFLRTHDLQYRSPNVGELDPDKDGFTNQEEFENNTNPKIASSHPPIFKKLFMITRVAKDYRMQLRSSSPPYQVRTPDDKRQNWFVEKDGVFGTGERFKFLGFENKVVPDPRTGEKDVSEMKVEDRVRKNEFTLVNGTDFNLADYSAEFEFRLKSISRWTTAKDGQFRIPGYEDVTYKVLDIQEDHAVIAQLNADGTVGEKIVVKKD